MCLVRPILDGLTHRNERLWNPLISGFLKDGKPQQALMLCHKMKENDFLHLNGSTLLGLFKACAKLRDLKSGLRLHTEVAKTGLIKKDLFVGNTLVDMFAKCGDLDKAHQVFNELVNRDVVSWTALMTGYTEQGHGEKALKCYKWMLREDVLPNTVTYICLLKACGSIGATDKGQEVHAEIQRKGLCERELTLGNTLVNMYVKFGWLPRAQEVFDKLPVRNVVSWTALISGYIEQDDAEGAMKCFESMKMWGVAPDPFTFACALKACGSLGDISRGIDIHTEFERKGMDKDHFLGSSLVDMYIKCNMPTRGREVFDNLVSREVVSWTSMISGYAEHGPCQAALQCLDQMQMECTFPNAATYICSLKACGSIKTANKGKELHAKLEQMGYIIEDVVVSNSLMDMYAKCGSLPEAQEVFDQSEDQDVVLWTTLIAGYVEHGDNEKALERFKMMESREVSPDGVTYVCTLKACGSLGNIAKGREIHAELERKGYLIGDVAICNVLLDMYAKCGELEESHRIFDKIPGPNVVSWNALITAYADHEHGHEALEFYEAMSLKGVCPDTLTFVCSLKACSDIGSVDKGRPIHAEIEKKGIIGREEMVGNALVDMYAKCGCVVESRKVFDMLPSRDIVCWNSLIGGYAEHGHGQEVLMCVELMKKRDISPTAVTYLCLLKACANLGARERGEEIHADIEKNGFLEQDLNIGNSLIDMYAKCGLLQKAEAVFNKLPVTNVVSWTALMVGYVEHELAEEALACFEQMETEDVSPNAATYVCGLKACGSIGAIEKGHDIHAEIERRGMLQRNLVVGNTLVDMYGKCGLLVKAEVVFDKLPVRNVVSWTALIGGYGEHGQEEDAIICLERMHLEGVSPDAFTLACSLRACGSIAAASKGQEIHAEIERKGVWEGAAAVQNSLIDMYAKCGLLLLAQEVFDKLIVRERASWNALIAGYIEHGQMGEALTCLERMQTEGVMPNTASMICSLKACSIMGAVEKGWELHAEIDREGLLTRDLVGNTLLDMYAKCGALSKAQEVFDNLPVQDVVSWTALIARYIEQGHGEEAFKCVELMERAGVFPDCVTYVCILKACASVGAIDKGRELHMELESKGLLESNLIIGNTLLNMYAVCGDLAEALRVFQKLPERDVVSWNALITGYVEAGEGESVFDIFDKMITAGVKPDAVTFLVILSACNNVGQFERGRLFFEVMRTHGIMPKNEHLTEVVDLHCRAGQLGAAMTFINKMLPLCPNLETWRMVLNTCRKWGNIELGKQAFELVLPFNDKELPFST